MCKISFLELAYNQYIKHKKNYGKKFRKLSPTNSWNINLMVAIRKQRRIGDSKKFDQEDFGKIVNNWVEFSANYRKPPKGWSTTNTQKVRRWTKKNKWPMAVELAQQIFGHRLCAHANALDSNVIRTKEESLASEEKNNDEKERKKERERERERGNVARQVYVSERPFGAFYGPTNPLRVHVHRLPFLSALAAVAGRILLGLHRGLSRFLLEPTAHLGFTGYFTGSPKYF